MVTFLILSVLSVLGYIWKQRGVFLQFATWIAVTAAISGWMALNSWKGPTSVQADAVFIISLTLGIAVITTVAKRKQTYPRLETIFAIIWLILGIGGISIYFLICPAFEKNAPWFSQAFIKLNYIMITGLQEPPSTIWRWGELGAWWAVLAFLLVLSSYALTVVTQRVWQWRRKTR